MFIINGINRKLVGKGSSRRLRLKNKFPAIIYGKKKKNLNIEIKNKDIKNIEFNKIFYIKPLIININKKKIKVKIHDIQWHSFKPKIIHIDFLII
ncbi:MAG: 50S ribosomal protein L25 [Enterobacteriaceae bacterium PSpicST2]|nr:MAG: 50S ribosomal protein L25 [Enterobacteriaceae bacterium PSpicST2]WMC19046.1 MAG: 50S ribosomal protein L25 [Enterobacteriaceae bacterium PSpicST1]